MPGMMDTVLNLGLYDTTVEALAEGSGDPRFAYDSYRRFITMYSNVVLDVEHHAFEEALEHNKETKGFSLDTELGAEDWKHMIGLYKKIVRDEHGADFPQGAEDQLWGAIGAVFSSCMIPRAKKYRELNNIPESWGTAVNVQAMVFGNMGDTSATGRRLHPQPLHRRAGALWRVPHQRPGRRRGGGHPHPAGHHREGTDRGQVRQAVDGAGDARILCRAGTDLWAARDPLPRHAGHGVHHRERKALDAPRPATASAPAKGGPCASPWISPPKA